MPSLFPSGERWLPAPQGMVHSSHPDLKVTGYPASSIAAAIDCGSTVDVTIARRFIRSTSADAYGSAALIAFSTAETQWPQLISGMSYSYMLVFPCFLSSREYGTSNGGKVKRNRLLFSRAVQALAIRPAYSLGGQPTFWLNAVENALADW
jgi:hypothetical protein